MSINRFADLGRDRGRETVDEEDDAPRRGGGRQGGKGGKGGDDAAPKPPVETNAKAKEDIAAQMKQYDEVSKNIDGIAKNVEKIKSLKVKDNKAADDAAHAQVSQELDKLLADCTARARAVKDAFDSLKEENAKFDKDPKNANSARSQVRGNLYTAHVRRFQSVMTAFNNAREDFRTNLQDRLVRQLKIVDSSKSEKEITQLVESGRAQDMIKQALVSDNLRDVVDDLRDRNAEILKLQRSVQELYELFKDLHSLVEMQGETLNVIESRISKAKDYTEKGAKALQEAQESQIKARKRKCCLIMIVLIILIVILVPILSTQLVSA